MYKNVSNKWDKNIYKNRQSVMNIYFDNVLINPDYITAFKKGNTLFDKELELGSTPSQYVELQIHKRANIQIPKQIKIEYGILINNALTVAEVNSMLVGTLNGIPIKSLSANNSSFEMIPIGIYNVDDYNDEDDNVINIKALDNMIKFEFNYDGSELISQNGKATLLQVAQDICNKAGVELGSTSFLNSEKQVAVYDNQITAREYIGYIAESAGCFACAGRDGKLYFRDIGQDEIEIPLELFGEYKWGEEYKISKVAYEDGVRSFKFGDETRNTLWINQENMYIVDEEQIENIYNKVKNLTINSFEGKTVIDPAIDIGDKIIIDGKTVIYQGEMSLAGRFIADIKSKIDIKQKQETTVKKESQKIINRRVQSEINQIDGKIVQLVEENSENSQKLTKHEQDIESITNTVLESTSQLTKDINNNHQDILQKLNDIPQNNDLITIQNKVETIEKSTEYAIKITEDLQVNGVSKVKTETGYTFNNEGLTIEKANAKTKSTLNETGLNIKDATGSSDESLLFAGYDEETGETIVKSKNMTVEKYLTIGTHSRIEDYESGTGVFWIGG